MDNKLKLVTGDLIALAKVGEFDIIVHGCNCWNTMAAGIARKVRAHFLDSAFADKDTLYGDRNKLGGYTIGISDRLIIVNAYTQYMTAKAPGEDVFEYKAFQTILDKLLARFGKCRFGFPRIGMGLAGGDPSRIIPMLEKFAVEVHAQGGSVTLVDYDKT